jgi:hypothetical protein
MKPVFVCTNRFNILNTSENVGDTEMHNAPKNNPVSNTGRKNPLPPPIVHNVGNFIDLRNDLINLVGSDSFYFKSSVNNLKIIANKNQKSY